MSARMAKLAPLFLLAACGRYGAADSDKPADTAPADSGEQDTGPTPRPHAEYAAILVMDGARIEETFGDETTWGEGYSDAWGGPTEEILPVMRSALVPQGALVKPGYATGITVTTTAHVDMLTSTRRTFAHFPMSGEGCGYYRPDVPTLYELLADQEALESGRTVFTGNCVHLVPVTWSIYPGMGENLGAIWSFITDEDDDLGDDDDDDGDDSSKPSKRDDRVVEDVGDWLQQGARLVAANLHQMDRAGHYNPGTYAEHVQKTDEPITELWSRIQSDETLRDNTVLVALADHGRHRFMEGDFPWAHHGCQCSGCREVPMLILGPGIKAGATVEGSYVIEDIGQTVGWLMGLEQPFGTGMVMVDALEGAPEVTQRSGAVRLRSSGDLVAWQEWRDDVSSRSQVVIDGEVFHDPAAIHMEDPVIHSGPDRDYACWRQLEVGGPEEYWSWQVACLQRENGTWQEMQAPVDEVWAFFAPSMVTDPNGRLYLAAAANENGNAEGAQDAQLLRWTSARGWEGEGMRSGALYFPTATSVAFRNDEPYVALVTSQSPTAGQQTRQVEVFRVDWPTGQQQTWVKLFTAPLGQVEGLEVSRMENPKLLATEAGFELIWPAIGPDGGLLFRSDSLEGEEWTTSVVDGSGAVLFHVAPAFGPGGEVVWARQGARGGADVCRLLPGEAASCQETGAPYIDSLAPTISGVTASVSDGHGQWRLVELTW